MQFRKVVKNIQLFIFLMLLYFSGKAQESGALFMLPNVSQASLLNPAYQNKTDKLVVSLPMISGTSLSWNTNFALNSLFSQGLWNYSFFDFYNNLEQTGEGQASARFSLFFASLNYRDLSFQVSLTERGYATTSFNREIVKLIRDGVEPYYGQNENFGAGNFNYQHFRELAFGVSQKYWEGLDIGIRPKILFGRMYFDAQNVNFSVETDTENEKLLVKPEGEFKLAGPITYRYDSVYDYTIFSTKAYPTDYSFNLHNLGFALDLGFVYRSDKTHEFSVSLLDLGFITFSHNTYLSKFKEPITYSKNNLYQSNDPWGDKYVESREALKIFGDSVSYVIDVKDSPLRSLEVLPFKVNIGSKFRYSQSSSVGWNNQFAFYGKHSVNKFSGLWTHSFNPRTDIGGSLSLYNLSSVWLGFGISHTREHIQYYLATNNILGIIQLAGSKHINLCFGINFLFATAKK